MARVKRGVTGHARHKKVLEQAKGFSGRRKNTIRAAKAAVDRAGQYAYRDRRIKKRMFRALWIQRINAAARLEGLTYSRFISGRRSPWPAPEPSCVLRGTLRPFLRAPCAFILLDQSVRLEAVGQVGPDGLGIRRRHHFRAAVLTDVLARVADETVTLTGDARLDLTRSRDLEALFGARLGLQFRHFASGFCNPVL